MDLAPSGRPVTEILDDAVAGRRISAGDAHTLLLEGDLLELGLAADEVRNRLNDPGVASYNVDRNINYTNICIYKCRFCAFYREPGDAEGYLLPFEEIGRKIVSYAKLRLYLLPLTNLDLSYAKLRLYLLPLTNLDLTTIYLSDAF